PFTLNVGSQLNLPFHQDLSLAFNVNLDLRFGVRKSDGAFFVVDPRLDSDTTSDAPQLTITPLANTGVITQQDTRLGFTDAKVTGGNFAFSGSMAIRLKDSGQDEQNPQPDNIKLIYGDQPLVSSNGWITGSEVLGNTDDPYRFDQLGEVTSDTIPSLTLNLATTAVGSLTAQSGPITVSWPSPLDQTPASLNTTQVVGIYKFNSIDSKDFIAGLKQLVPLYQQILGPAALGSNIPLVGGQLAKLAKFDQVLSQALSDLENNAGENPTLQSIASQLSAIDPNITISATPSGVSLTVTQKKSLVNQTIQFSASNRVPLGLFDTQLQAQGTMTVNGSILAQLTAGMLFGSGDSSVDQTTSATRFYVDANAASTNGRVELSGSGNASVSLNLGLKKVTGAQAIATINPSTLTLKLQGQDNSGRIT
ncbi:MAG: hypothetical protein KDA72_21925, partial [Planctomycetales bacterium]|nr:hypothetical protein [Planctomycetales bacterium]